jgi:hypothetical protein
MKYKKIKERIDRIEALLHYVHSMGLVWCCYIDAHVSFLIGDFNDKENISLTNNLIPGMASASFCRSESTG